MSLDNAIAKAIFAASGKVFKPEKKTSVGGGCINTTELLEGGGQRYFLKRNTAARFDMFEAEAAGLTDIANSNCVRVPRPICLGATDDHAFLVLEYLDLGHSSGTGELLGQQLAAMHRTTHTHFGWRRDNTIGSTPQINTENQNWVMFYREHRLRFQFELAEQNGFGGSLAQRGGLLLEKLPVFFSSYQPFPSLVHGDLWGGNHSALRDGTPVIFDPAVYFGDRETDLAMTELFGGFGSGFHAAYREAWPLDSGYRVRRDLYNLYHVLNHLNLFGGGYRGQAGQIIDKLLSET